MLPYLDTAIGFAVVMLGMSLFTTILTQAVSAMLNHRGGNLRWGLKTLFANVDPVRFPALTAQADSIAPQVLAHPLISDSWFSGNRVTASLGAAVPLLGKLFGRYNMATAIRPNELADILRRLSNSTLAGTPVAAEIQRLLDSNPAAVRETAGTLEGWFSSMMDRASQKFVTYMRLWTMLFACLLAFGTGLNTIELLNELHTNGALRQKLVNTAGPLTEEAARVLTDGAGDILAGGFDVMKVRWPDTFSWKYLFGVIVTAGLLSLGAPFWFNALKSLTNLRPVVANKAEAKT